MCQRNKKGSSFRVQGFSLKVLVFKVQGAGRVEGEEFQSRGREVHEMDFDIQGAGEGKESLMS